MPYLDNFNIAGSTLKIRDLEAREILAKFVGSISGSVGDSNKPIFLEKGNFKECSDILNVSISGNANSATEANHALSADNATEANHALSADNATEANSATEANHALSADSATTANTANSATEANHALSANNATNANTATALASSAGSATRPVYFNSGKPVQCGNTLDVNISGTASKADSATTATNATTATALASSAGTGRRPVYFNEGKPVQCGTALDVSVTGNAKTSGTRSEISNGTVHVYTCMNDRIKTMDGYTEEKTYNITNGYGGLYYADVTINLPTYFNGLLCVNVTSQGPQACYFNVTTFNGTQINGFLVCPISISVNLALFFHVVGY